MSRRPFEIPPKDTYTPTNNSILLRGKHKRIHVAHTFLIPSSPVITMEELVEHDEYFLSDAGASYVIMVLLHDVLTKISCAQQTLKLKKVSLINTINSLNEY